MRIVSDDIDRVTAAADLYELVSATVQLKVSGAGTYMGLCPFHDEKTPSFSIRPELGIWHCFGCGAGGDTIRYVERTEGIGFIEAVEYLADKYNIELRYESSGMKNNSRDDRTKPSSRARLLQICQVAQDFFQSNLTEKEALPARKMLAERKFSQADCERFGCGYALNEWNALTRYLAGKGFTQQEMIDAGVARQGPRGVYDYFRGRVTWPIRDAMGRTLGFGARRLYDDDPVTAKYMNTPDTVLYRKNKVLYGLDIAKPAIVKKRQIVVVEGYTDVMACHLAGVDTAVATCGTAFGAEHVKIARRYIRDDSLGGIQLRGAKKDGSCRIIFTFDGDKAGREAMRKAYRFDNDFLTQTYATIVENNLDPCDLRIQRGDAAVRDLIQKASPLYEQVIRAAVNEYDMKQVSNRADLINRAAEEITAIRDVSLHDEFSRFAAGLAGADWQTVRDKVREADRRRGAVSARENEFEQRFAPKKSVFSDEMILNVIQYARDNYQNRPINSETRIADPVFIREQQFFMILILLPQLIDNVLFSYLEPSAFKNPVFRSLFEAVVVAGGLPDDDMKRGEWINKLLSAAGSGLESAIRALLVLPLPYMSYHEQRIKNSERRINTLDLSVGSIETTEEEKKLARSFLADMLDGMIMSKIAEGKLRMQRETDEKAKIELLSELTELEKLRRDMQAQIYAGCICLSAAESYDRSHMASVPFDSRFVWQSVC